LKHEALLTLFSFPFLTGGGYMPLSDSCPPRAHHKPWTVRDKVAYVIVAGLVGTAYTFYIGAIILFFLKRLPFPRPPRGPTTSSSIMSEKGDSYFLPLIEDVLDKVRNDPASITTEDARRLSENAVVGDLRTATASSVSWARVHQLDHRHLL
jgi:hypothetical protein